MANKKKTENTFFHIKFVIHHRFKKFRLEKKKRKKSMNLTFKLEHFSVSI